MTQDVSAFIPEVWSKKLGLMEKKRTNIKNTYCNRNYEGEIKEAGDTVRISFPDPSSVTITTGISPSTSAVTPTQTSLVIDQTKSFAFKFSDIEKAQSQFDMIAGYSSLGGELVDEAIDLQLLTAIFADTTIETFGSLTTSTTATTTTTISTLSVTADTSYNFAVDIRVKQTEKNVITGGGYYTFKGNNEEPVQLSPVLTVTPKLFGYFLKSTQLTHPTMAGDDILKSGQRSMIAGYEIEQNTQLNALATTTYTTQAQPFVAGTKMGITFASQFTKVEKLRDPDSFSDIVRALYLYGYKVVHPKSLIKGFVNVA